MKNLNSILLLCVIYLLIFLQCLSMSQTTEYEMLVSSRNTHSVKRFNAQTGSYIDDFISAGSGGLNTPQDVIKKPDGNILVSGRGNTSILMYDKSTGAFVGPFTNGYTLDNPTKIAYGPDGYVYVSQWGTSNQKVVRFDGNGGNFISEFTQSLNLPLGHTWDSEGNLYVACYGSRDVRKFDTSGNFLGIFTETGHLQGPTNLWFDNTGNLFVIDWVLGSVIQFNAITGGYIRTFISGLQNAEGYSFGPDSNLYICDWSQNLIKRYTPGGTLIGIFTNQGNMLAPNSILFRPVKIIAVEEGTNIITDNFSLKQNYPNPFNPGTIINYELRITNYVTLKVFNSLGKEVATLVNQKQSEGSYSVDFNAANLPSGIYYYSLKTDGISETKKMILLK
jgi:sugar lactone lactonase YvrE